VLLLQQQGELRRRAPLAGTAAGHPGAGRGRLRCGRGFCRRQAERDAALLQLLAQARHLEL
jgi:hypothetical protein